MNLVNQRRVAMNAWRSSAAAAKRCCSEVPSVAVVVVVVASVSPVAAEPAAVTVKVAPAAIAYSYSALLASVSVFHYNKTVMLTGTEHSRPRPNTIKAN